MKNLDGFRYEGKPSRAAGPIQLCAGQMSGVEAAIHSMRAMFSTDHTEGMLLVDASNTFNSLNRNVALHNIQHICLAFFSLLVNTYRCPAPLYINGGIFFTLMKEPLREIL